LIPIISSPFWFEDKLASEDYQKLGKLSLRWSHIDQLIANCLKKLPRLTDDEARVVVSPLNTDTRLKRIRKLEELEPLRGAAKEAFDELHMMMTLLQPVRNNVIHAVIMYAEGGAPIFELRSHGRRSFILNRAPIRACGQAVDVGERQQHARCGARIRADAPFANSCQPKWQSLTSEASGAR
jgi:hypothetical protein